MPSTFFHNATTEDIGRHHRLPPHDPAGRNDVPKVDWMAAFGMPPMQNAPAME